MMRAPAVWLAILALAACACAAQPSTVTAVSVTGLPVSLPVGQTAQLSAVATLSNGSTRSITAEATWTSTNTLAALVSSTGFVTGVGTGAVEIRATFEGVSGVRATSVVPSPAIPGVACGVERWSVKTLSDDAATRIDVNVVQQTTVRDLNLLPVHCSGLPDLRTFMPEFQVFEVVARITLVRPEDDLDFHVVLADPADARFTIVTEVADPQCQGAVTSSQRQALIQARADFDAIRAGRSLASLAGTLVKVRGVGFYDFNHGQTGRSQSCLELHPVLSLERLQ